MKPGKKEKENEKEKKNEKASLITLRKSCPSCGSLCISRLTRKGGYSCAKCGAAFQQPVMKETNRVFYGAGPKFIQADKGART